jgi:hypothetical protein
MRRLGSSARCWGIRSKRRPVRLDGSRIRVQASQEDRWRRLATGRAVHAGSIVASRRGKVHAAIPGFDSETR